MKYILFCLSIILTASSGFAQKVKYKDLFVLLRVENYTDADKYLRLYLQQEPEEPHANYAMGRMLQTYLNEGDLLNGSARLKELADSSIIYYNKALNLTTEKYVKKHDDDYYADFRRRDMRTGKFEVKFSDVQFDIEERIGTVSKFNSDLDKLLDHFKKAQTYYAMCQSSFDSLVTKSNSEKHLFLTSTTDEVNLMRDMMHYYDSSLYHLNTYRAIMKGMGKSAVIQQLNENEIKSYPEGGQAEVDFYTTTIEYLNYKAWAKTTVDIILKQIYPLKKRLITFDERVKTLHDQVVEDSLDKRDEVFLLATQNVGRDLRDYDSKSLPAAIFNYRIAEINYHSTVYYWLREVADTVDIGLKKDMLNGFSKQIMGVSKLVHKMHEANTPGQIDLYNQYVLERYESPEGLTKFIVEHEEEVREDSLQLVRWLAELEELDKIAIWQTDSVILTPGVTNTLTGRSFTTIVVDTLATRTYGFYAWEKANDSLSLDFGVAPSSRQIDSLFKVAINPAVYDPTLPVPEFLMDTVGLSQRIWLLQAGEIANDGGFPTQLFMTDYTIGAAWSRDLQVSGLVTQVKKDNESGNVLILGNNDVVLARIDKYGQPVDANTTNKENPEEPDKNEEEEKEQQENEEGSGGQP